MPNADQAKTASDTPTHMAGQADQLTLGNQSQPDPPSQALQMLALTQDILDKKYILYGWCETKISTLVTLNSLLSAAIFVVIKSAPPANTAETVLVAASLVPILLSLAIALFHIEPKMQSGRTDAAGNIRSVVGTEQYESDTAYLEALERLTIEDVAALNAKQAFGMNRNIWKNQRAIRFAAGCSALGLLSFFAFMIKMYF